MATTVQVELVVDEKGAVQGVRTFGASTQATTAAVKQLNDQLRATAQSATASLSKMGSTAQTAGERLRNAMVAYDAAAAKGTQTQIALAAAFDQAKAKGMGFVEATEAAVKALNAEGAAAKRAAKATGDAASAQERAAERARRAWQQELIQQDRAIEAEKRVARARELAALKADILQRSGSKAVDALGGHALTSLDQVRLLSQMFGLRMPRAMESAISRSRSLMAVLTSIQPLMLAAGGVGIGVAAGRELYELYEKYFSLTAQTKAYNKEVEKSRFEAFGDPQSIEETTRRIAEAARTVRFYSDEVQKSQKSEHRNALVSALYAGTPVMAIAGVRAAFAAHQAQQAHGKQLQFQRTSDTLLQEKSPEQRHEAILDAIKSDPYYMPHPGESRASQIRRQLNARIAENAENRKYEVAKTAVKGNTLVAAAGEAHQKALDTEARVQAAVELFDIEREQTTELRHLREQALQAGLRGAALYKAQESAAIADITEKLKQQGASRQQIAAEIDAVHSRFHAEELRRIEDENRELQQMRGEATVAGLTGVAKIEQEGRNRLQAIYADPNHSDAFKAYAGALSNTQTQNEKVASEQEFTDRIKALHDQLVEHESQGFARIRAEGERQIDSLREAFEKEYSTPELQAQHAGELQQGIGDIRKSTQDQQAELTRRNAAETEEIEDQARARFFSAEKNKTAAIEEEYRARLRKLEEQLSDQQISYDDYNRRVAAADMEMQAQLVEQAQQARQKIASELSGIIGPHPLEGLQRLGSKFAAEAGAAILQRAAGHYGVAQPRRGSIFDRIAGVQHSTIDQHAELPGMRGTATGAGIFSVGSATIHVGSANILGGGVSAGAGFGYMPPGIGGGVVSPSFSGAGGGGAGISFSGATAPAPGAGFAGIAPPSIAPSSGGFSGVANTVLGGAHTASSILSMMKKPAAGLETQTADRIGHFDKNGNYTSGGSLFGKDTALSHTLSLGSAGLGLFSAFKTGGAGGMMGGAMSGAQMGLELGGPIGAAVGAIAGLTLGFFGGAGQARLYNERQVLPRIGNDTKGFESGSMDYSSAYSDLQSLEMEARAATNKMGFVGERYYQSTIKGELSRAMANLNREERAGRSQFGFSAASFDTGTDYVPRDGAAFIHRGEAIFRADQNERVTRSVEGAHRLYQMAMQSSVNPAMRGGDRNLNMTIHAMDSRSIHQFFMGNKHVLRDAYNASLGENSGGADASY